MTPAEVLAACGAHGEGNALATTTALVIGAGTLRLKPQFDACGVRDVVWVEARPWAVSFARDKYPATAKRVLQACVSNITGKTVKLYELRPGHVGYSSCCMPCTAVLRSRLRGYRLMRTVTVCDLLAQNRHCLPERASVGQSFDIAWIDTCGYELQVLEGMRNVPHIVYVRTHSSTHTGATTPSQLDAFFNAIGYALVSVHDTPDNNTERVYKF